MDSNNKKNQLTHALMINDSLHQLFNEVSSVAVQGYDENRRVIYWNMGSELLYGYKTTEALGQTLESLIIPKAMQDVVIADIKNWLENDIEIPAAELTLRHKNGYDVCVFSNHVLFTNTYNDKQFYCIDIDLAEIKKTQAKLALNEHMLAAAFESIPDLFFLMNEEGVINHYHASNEKKLYLSPKKFVGQSIAKFLPTDIASKFIENINKAMGERTMTSFEYELNLPNGASFFEARISYLSEYKQLVMIIRDITEQHKAAKIIRHHAYYDTLTSLPNRFLALDRLSQLLNEAQRKKEKTAVLFLDLDDFKKVNDSLGHEVGDNILKESAHRLNQVVRKEDTVGRLGGDEFIVILRGLTDGGNALTITKNLLNAFRDPFKIDGRELILTLSIGIAIYPDNGTNSTDLLRNADLAMYQAKALGRNTYSFFTQEMNITMIRRLAIEEQMHGAIDRNEFQVYYQPQIDLRNNCIIGAEALLRWRNPALGDITPDEFIPIAEHTGLIVPIGHFVVQQALNFLCEWQNSQQAKYIMAVNLSPRQFRETELLGFVKNSLDEANITANCLELEITEGVLMVGQSYIDDALLKLHKLGVKLSMDDFGTGYSSLSYLRQYDFDVLKIDRSFIKGITENKADLSLVKATISMAHSLGLTVVAEGVETKEQVRLLSDLKCDFLQGYYFSKPVPDKQLIDYSLTYK
jgi:diguanylate cyclase (GGDEF)-like protein/PAS domain S-box-containing protein